MRLPPRLSGILLSIPSGIVPVGVGLAAACSWGARSADAVAAPSGTGAQGTRVVRVTRDGSGDLTGADDAVLNAALELLKEGGGRLEIGPGRWLVRNSLRIPSGVTVRGEEGTVLAMPAPVRLARAARAGDLELHVAGPHELVAGTVVEALPPEEGWSGWGPETPLQERFVQIAGVDAERLTLARPLTRDIAEGGRIGTSQKMLWVATAADITIENLVLDGGRRSEIPMPGHHKRSAVWVGSYFSHDEGPIAEPSRNVTVRHCLFRNLYGRGVAMYNTTDSAVVGCRFRDIADEAIDFDHFTYRCRAVGNDIRRAVYGVTINDGSDIVVEHNRIADCDTGLTIWWLDSVRPDGLNRGNVLRHNTLSGSRKKAISLLAGCRDNVVRDNFVEGEVEVLEPANDVGNNWRLEPGSR